MSPKGSMMLPKKLPKRLFKSKDVIHSYQHDRSAKSRMKQMSSAYEDVLQNIEIALVGTAHQDPTIDDRMIDEALQISINRMKPPRGTDSRVVRLWERLGAMRELREDVSGGYLDCMPSHGRRVGPPTLGTGAGGDQLSRFR